MSEAERESKWTDPPLEVALAPMLDGVLWAPIWDEGVLSGVLWVAASGEFAGARHLATGLGSPSAGVIYLDQVAKEAAFRSHHELDAYGFLRHWRESLAAHPSLTVGEVQVAESVDDAEQIVTRGALSESLP